jgi:hypothetical protein
MFFFFSMFEYHMVFVLYLFVAYLLTLPRRSLHPRSMEVGLDGCSSSQESFV